MSRSFRYSPHADEHNAPREDTRRKARKVTEAMSRLAWDYMAETETAIRDTVRDLQGRGAHRSKREG